MVALLSLWLPPFSLGHLFQFQPSNNTGISKEGLPSPKVTRHTCIYIPWTGTESLCATLSCSGDHEHI